MSRIHEIMAEERAATLSFLDRLDYPADIKPDILSALMAILDVVNSWVAIEGRVIDQRVVPMACALIHEELERIHERLQAEGVAPLSHKLQ